MKKHKNNFLTMASYGTGKFLAEFSTGAYGIMVYYFFEKEMNVNAFYVALATIIFSVWNAINDPLIGYLTGKENRLTKRYGKYSPWIVLGIIFCFVSYIAIFAVPKPIRNNGVLVFLWMVFFICLYDGFYSLWEVNYQEVFPDKFRTSQERTKTAVISTSIGVFGIALGAVLPPLFYSYGNPESFLYCAFIISIIGFIGSFLIRRGVRITSDTVREENPESRTETENAQIQNSSQNSSYQVPEHQISEHQVPEHQISEHQASDYQVSERGFFKSIADVLKYREFVALVLMLFLYQSACMCMTSSVNYVVSGVLGLPSSATTFIFAGMLIGTLLSVLIWKQVAKKIQNNNQKLLVITCIVMALASFALFFVNTQNGYVLGMFAWGLGFGGFWTFMAPAMADISDSVVVSQKFRQDGVLMGVRAFFMRLSYTSQAMVFWLCHKFTNYNANIEGRQSDLAVLGIKLHISVIPSLFFLLAALSMLFLNTLTPEKVADNKKKLLELGL